MRIASFKSCPREGASPAVVVVNDGLTGVSSHAPVRGHQEQLSNELNAAKFQVMPP